MREVTMSLDGANMLGAVRAFVATWRTLEGKLGREVTVAEALGANPYAAALVRALLSPVMIELLAGCARDDPRSWATLEALCESLHRTRH
jgi:hypothetical protein